MTETALAPAGPIIAGIFGHALRPRKRLRPSVWTERYFVLPDGPRKGEPFDMSLTPYFAEIIDEMAPEKAGNKGAVRKSQQTGLTTLGIAWACSLADQAPNTIGYYLPNIDLLRDFDREKLMPVLRSSERMREIFVPITSRDGDGSTTSSKRFCNCTMLLLNANSEKSFRSRTLKYAVGDEIDAWPDNVDGSGDPLGLLEGRFTAFHAEGGWKEFLMSTPLIEGQSVIDDLFKGGDQRYWTMTCPGCGAPLVFNFKHLKFARMPPYGSHYVTECCGTVIESWQRRELVMSGHFVATNPEGSYPSWHVDALISLLTTWDKLAEQWWVAQDSEQKLQAFVNTWLGLPFAPRGDAPDWEKLYSRREDYPEGVIPAGGLIVTIGADVQHNGIWMQTVAFGRDKQSWVVTRRFLEGDTTDAERGAWTKLTVAYEEIYRTAYGDGRTCDFLAVDAGDGGRQNQVLAWCRGRPRAFAIKGMPGWTTPAIGTPSKTTINAGGQRIGRGNLWPIGTWPLKSVIYDNMRKIGVSSGFEIDPPGFIHFGTFLDGEYFRQMTAETLVDVVERGRKTRRWKPIRENHLLDCYVYAQAMAEYAGLTRMTDEQWSALAAIRGVPMPLKTPDLLAPSSEIRAATPLPAAKSPPPRPRRQGSIWS